jgi:hypothetical protein
VAARRSPYIVRRHKDAASVMDATSQIIAELDAMHDRARDAFARRDIAAYRYLMAPNLKYRQADGQIIGRDRLMRDVGAQFRRLNRFQSSFSRQQIDIREDLASETLIQSGSVAASAFFIVHRSWDFMRKGRYTWRKSQGRWWIEEVEVLEEQVVRGRVKFGLRPPAE